MGWESIDVNAYNRQMRDAGALEAQSRKPSVTLEDLLNRYDNSWQMQGGYDNRAAVNSKYDKMRGTASSDKNAADAKLNQLYTQLTDAYSAIPEQTRQRYLDSINAGQAGAEGLMSATRARIDAEAAQRAAAYADMGVGGSGEATATGAQAERGIGDVSAAQANWAGLMGAQQQAEMNRNTLDVTGARDAGTMARGDLTTRYNQYLNQLEQQRQQELAGAVGGGSMVNTSGISSGLYGDLQRQYLQNQGILPAPQSAFDKFKQEWDYKRNNPMPSSSSSSPTTPPWQ